MILICLKLEYTKVGKFAVMLLNTAAPMTHRTVADLRQPRLVGKLLKGTSVWENKSPPYCELASLALLMNSTSSFLFQKHQGLQSHAGEG